MAIIGATQILVFKEILNVFDSYQLNLGVLMFQY